MEILLEGLPYTYTNTQCAFVKLHGNLQQNAPHPTDIEVRRSKLVGDVRLLSATKQAVLEGTLSLEGYEVGYGDVKLWFKKPDQLSIELVGLLSTTNYSGSSYTLTTTQLQELLEHLHKLTHVSLNKYKGEYQLVGIKGNYSGVSFLNGLSGDLYFTNALQTVYYIDGWYALLTPWVQGATVFKSIGGNWYTSASYMDRQTKERLSVDYTTGIVELEVIQDDTHLIRSKAKDVITYLHGPKGNIYTYKRDKSKPRDHVKVELQTGIDSALLPHINQSGITETNISDVIKQAKTYYTKTTLSRELYSSWGLTIHPSDWAKVRTTPNSNKAFKQTLLYIPDFSAFILENLEANAFEFNQAKVYKALLSSPDACKLLYEHALLQVI